VTLVRQCLTQCARKGDWLGARFRCYASRIRELSIRDLSSEMCHWVLHELLLHPDVLCAWLSYSAEIAPLFHNLRSLRWDTRGMDDLPVDLFLLFLGPSLIQLCFTSLPQDRMASSYPVQEYIKTLLLMAHARCPLLASLDIGSQDAQFGWSSKPLDGDFVSTVKIRIEQLQSFRCHAELPVAFMRRLALLPHLRCIDAAVHPDLTFHALKHVFPAVRELHFGQMTPAQASELLSIVESDCIRVLGINFRDSDENPLAGLKLLLQIVALHPSASSLRDVYLATARDWRRSQQSIVPGDIAPILDLPRIRLCVMHDFVMDHPEHIVDCMLRAWPKLEELDIGPSCARMPLAAFLDVARTHPRLRDVSKAIVITQDAGFVLPDAGAFVHYALRDIRMSYPDVPECASVAHILSTTFPGLHKLHASTRLAELLCAGQRARASGMPLTEDGFRLQEARLEAAEAVAQISESCLTVVCRPFAVCVGVIQVLCNLCFCFQGGLYLR
jgi:hypothetical protein